MMLYPPMASLVDKVGSRYLLVNLVARRARQIAAEAAKRLGAEKMSAQAVGGAVGHNPISLMIPCHRVVGTSGSLTGYGGGIARKVKLLELEHADMRGLFVPKTGTCLLYTSDAADEL